jgi:hypothetical protein
MIRLERASVDMIWDVRSKWLMMFWKRDSVMGWVVRGEQSVEKTMEFPLAYVTNVTKIHKSRLP